MNALDSTLSLMVIVLPWLAGIALAKEFWSTVAAIFFPPYAWYLVVEHALAMAQWL